MRTLTAVPLSTLIVVIAVGCGGSGSSGPLVTVSPASLTVETGGDAVTFQADLSNGATGPVSWTLDPATGLGTLSSATGLQTVYTPPPLGGSPGTLKVRAQASGNVGYTATVTVNAATTGALTIAVPFLPTASPAALTVTGPGGSQNVSTLNTVTLNRLAPGSYTVSAAEITSVGSYVSAKYAANDVQVSVTTNAVANATVNYLPEPGYGLWIAEGSPSVALLGFTQDDLQAQYTASSTVTTSATAEGLAFDASGDLWASIGTALVRYTAASLALPSPPPAQTISGLSGASGVAIGPGSLVWVANCTGNSLQAYTAGGTLHISITGTSSGLACPRGIAFDGASPPNLWVANQNGDVVRFSAATISATTTTATHDLGPLTKPGTTAAPVGLAIDTAGNLWVSFCTGDTVARYAKSGTGVATTASVVLTANSSSGTASLACPTAIAFDNSGNLWVGNRGNTTLTSVPASALGATGSPATFPQHGELQAGIDYGGLAIHPKPAGLPILP